ncbi:MAG: mismatch repair protein [Gammaproteobacteria bacterium]
MFSTEQYAQRLRAREASLAQLNRLHARLGGVRLAVGAAFLFTAWLCFGRFALAPAWLLIPVAAFIGLVFYHQRVRTRGAQAHRAVEFYRAGIARMADQWRGSGPSGEQFDIPHHTYSSDLDLFGTGSLFELLCAARTPMGHAALAQWLLAPANLATIRERHASITDLRGRLDLREELAVQGEPAQITLHPETIIAWARAPNRLEQAWIRRTAPLLAVLAVGSVVVWGIAGVLYPLLAVLLAETAVAYFLREPIRQAITAIESAYEDLKGLSLLLNRIEAEHFDAAPLRALVLKLSSHTQSASATFSKLATIVNFVESRRNPLLAPLLLLVMYPLQAALAAERWRRAHGHVISSWLGVLGEIEALLSLSRYAYESPEDPYPEFIDGAATFAAADLGHPLIPAATRIRNDVDICGSTRVLLVSGSNMSGKSTLLRTVGINTVLAMAGAPVRAKRMRLTPLKVGASIRINDSLHEGSSRFYAEITRLRQLFEPAALPLLFLLDELLQGTNSADRRIGAHGVIRALIERGAIGLISTHDLALTDIDGLAAGALENVHFQDELLDGKLKFDFKLHPGIVTKSNGIELMRSIGLDV